MERNNPETLTTLGVSFKATVDNIGTHHLTPKKMEDTLRQGTFALKCDWPVLGHYDSCVGDHCKIRDILAALN
jgi:hypothetical protein